MLLHKLESYLIQAKVGVKLDANKKQQKLQFFARKYSIEYSATFPTQIKFDHKCAKYNIRLKPNFAHL
jgi:hypothetical protein